MGAPEFIILFIWLLFALWGYNAGKERNIGSTTGLLLGLFLGFIGVIIVYCSRKIIYEQPFYTNESTADQLKKYKDLLDSGAITESEYNIQKGKLLNQ
ncbi:SHOCT domain-containing protein [Mucilaginibacter polytrichastri]|uniref:SHOCT domain-containing protein n=1 Tax=Mucilaginibacter polytrichastri TaxID=1302689 RepID=A0A1Q6A4Y0_9SPHI|nr:SHOCT domain-containing protein [Mucilaginibacter polytrichastri]OKS89059.1 hypothetical protein RG47T_4539 [Mucilaginibacter polytrichastri]SFS95959.1 Short C-terminal domain-containing protein [Mucilaginibacter polytrichastri]